jgi:phytanoyl-CoA hydroxylase
MLSDAQKARFDEDGFLAAGPLGDPAELGWIGELCDLAFRRRYGCTPDGLAEADPDAPPADLLTIVSPEGDQPDLTRAAAVAEARDLVARLFDVSADKVLLGWRLFVKPAGGGETAWHQDAAYRPPPHRGATVWMPIDAPDGPSSSLLFLPGTHRGPLLPHDFDAGHMAAAGIDPSRAQTAQVRLGEASVHHCLTLHAAGRNATDRPRRAAAMVCQVTG